MKIELTIKTDYLPTWGMAEGIRELLQNAKDAETEFSAPMDVRVRTTSADTVGTLVITNEGCTMPYQALLLGHTTKAGRGDMIGHYGEGLKLGILALLRAGHDVKIRNGSEVWVPELVHSEKFDAKVLCFDIQTGRKDESRIQIEISNITPEMYREDIRPRFLWLDKDGRRKDDIVETSYGNLLLSDRYKGKLFVKGIFVENRPNLSVGYDFSNCDVDRDRKMVSTYDFQYATRNVWSEAVGKRPDLFGALFSIIEENGPEAQSFDSYSSQYLSDDFQDHVVSNFVAKYGKLAVPVGNLAESADIEHFGRQGIIVNKPMRAILENKMGTLSKVQESLKAEVIRTYSWGDLSSSDKMNLENAIKRLSAVPCLGEVITLADVSVCDFRSVELEGMFSADEGIKLAHKVLADPALTLGVLIHEVSHRKGADGDKGHVAEIERVWAEVYRNMTP